MPPPRFWRSNSPGEKIRVNAIMLGYFDTEGARAIGVRGSEQEAQLIAATPLERRPGHPSDQSPVAIFLASRASAWINGSPHGFRGKTLNGSQPERPSKA